jgi:hypothetical protein
MEKKRQSETHLESEEFGANAFHLRNSKRNEKEAYDNNAIGVDYHTGHSHNHKYGSINPNNQHEFCIKQITRFSNSIIIKINLFIVLISSSFSLLMYIFFV